MKLEVMLFVVSVLLFIMACEIPGNPAFCWNRRQVESLVLLFSKGIVYFALAAIVVVVIKVIFMSGVLR